MALPLIRPRASDACKDVPRRRRKVWRAAVLFLPLVAPGADAQQRTFAEQAAALYAAAPDIGACRTGRLSEQERRRVVATVNEVRALHRLAPVTYDAANEPATMQAALMMAANGRLDHRPGPSWRCYSAAGARVAAESNLHGGTVSPYLPFYDSPVIIAGWISDVRNSVPDNVGHRRWLLDPFLTRIAYGRVAATLPDGRATDAAAIRISGDPGASPAQTPAEFVAYPFGDYPARFYADGAILSFSVIADRTDRWANRDVDLRNARVTVTQRGGRALPVRNLRTDRDGYGLPNNLQFTTDLLVRGSFYDVSISNVIVAGTARTFRYAFRIVP